MHPLFKNGTAYKTQYLYKFENSLYSDNRAFSFMKVHLCGQ